MGSCHRNMYKVTVMKGAFEMNNNNKRFEGSYRVFGKNCRRSEDTWATGLNNNVLVVGNPGCRKTGSYVVPNLYSTTGSIIVADTKGTLYGMYAKELRKRGYKVHLLDFVNPENSEPFNILDGIRRMSKQIRRTVHPGEIDDNGNVLLEAEYMDVTVETYRQMDVNKIAALLLPLTGNCEDRFWIESARVVMTCLIAYVLEQLPKEEQHMGSVARLFYQLCSEMQDQGSVSFLEDLEATEPESYALKKYNMFRSICRADRTWVCISQFCTNALDIFVAEENAGMLCRSGIDLAVCGMEKTALFLNISDCDRSQDNIVNAFYTQLYQKLIEKAYDLGGRLKVPCHIILDDFAANVYIQDFDKVLSVIRSRDISTTVILQSLSQLNGMYNEGQASTIINDCDTMLYMGGQDVRTAKFFADKAGKLPETILALPNDKAWLFTRGEEAKVIEKLPPYSAPDTGYEIV